MNIEELQKNWQQYVVEVDVDFPELGRQVRGKIVLKKQFFVCFREQRDNALLFDPGGHDPKCIMLRPDDEDNCYMKFPSGRWIKIGKFIRAEE
jgi:hypothetical protein